MMRHNEEEIEKLIKQIHNSGRETMITVCVILIIAAISLTLYTLPQLVAILRH